MLNGYCLSLSLKYLPWNKVGETWIWEISNATWLRSSTISIRLLPPRNMQTIYPFSWIMFVEWQISSCEILWSRQMTIGHNRLWISESALLTSREIDNSVSEMPPFCSRIWCFYFKGLIMVPNLMSVIWPSKVKTKYIKLSPRNRSKSLIIPCVWLKDI